MNRITRTEAPNRDGAGFYSDFRPISCHVLEMVQDRDIVMLVSNGTISNDQVYSEPPHFILVASLFLSL